MKNRNGKLVPMLWALVSVLAPVAMAQSKGQVVLQQNFEGPEPLKAWNAVPGPLLRLVAGKDGQALLVERAGGVSTMLHFALPIDIVRGCKIKIEAQVKAEGVSEKPNPWNGIKVMLHAKTAETDVWPQAPLGTGTFDWQTARFVATVPNDAQRAELTLGLEEVTGKAWFDNVKITIVGLPRKRPAVPSTEPRYKGHDLPMLRGVMISPNLKPEDLRVLAGWGANHVRWQLLWNGFPHSPADNGDLAAYDAWMESALKHLDSMLPLCRELGIRVVVDVHTPPGGRNPDKECRLFKEKRFQDAFLVLWEKIARRYKNEKFIWGYDLVNEPVEGELGENCLDWHDLAAETVKRVRTIDADHAIIIEGAPWGGPAALVDFEPLPFERIVYSFHMYEPGQFTHQGVNGPSEPIRYPGMIAGKQWDKEQIRRALKLVMDWQRDYNVHLYVGEFSAIRWAPGESARNYLRDCIEIFEENNWDWAYHAFREWPGWSVEHTGDKDHTQFSPTPTSRQQLLMDWFAKNKK